MTICAVKFCHNASGKQDKGSGVTFHRFPSDPVIASRWIKNIRLCRKEACWNPTKNTRVCSTHFEDKHIYTTKGGLRKLHRDGVPTKNLHISCSKQDNDIITEKSNDEETPSTERQLQSSKSQENANEEEESSIERQIQSDKRSLKEDDMESIFDTQQKAQLQKKLKKITLLHIKHIKLIKSLRQQNRILKKKNKSLKDILSEIKKSN